MLIYLCVMCFFIYVYIFNIVWRYTYSIRLFLIEAKHRYKGKNINRKHTLKIYIRLFHSALISLDPLLGYQREEHLYFLNRQRHCYFVVDAKRCVCLNRSCVRSFAGCADLNLAGWAIDEGLVSQVQ